MHTAICLLAVAPVRKEPSHRSEMVSQLLFGEYVAAGEEKEDFVSVRCLYDGYEGWVQAKQLTPVEDVAQTAAFCAAFATPVSTPNGLLHIPYGSPVFQTRGNGFTVANERFEYLVQAQQVWDSASAKPTPAVLQALYQPYLNVPYLWGGKSVFGVDCSGFVQQVFKMLGVPLLRDAYLQAEQGTVVNLSEARLGDLAFFCNDGGRVTHVGIVLGGGKIVHASGKVRVDELTGEGIVAFDTGKRSHTFHSIKRYLS